MIGIMENILENKLDENQNEKREKKRPIEPTLLLNSRIEDTGDPPPKLVKLSKKDECIPQSQPETDNIPQELQKNNYNDTDEDKFSLPVEIWNIVMDMVWPLYPPAYYHTLSLVCKQWNLLVEHKWKEVIHVDLSYTRDPLVYLGHIKMKKGGTLASLRSLLIAGKGQDLHSSFFSQVVFPRSLTSLTIMWKNVPHQGSEYLIEGLVQLVQESPQLREIRFHCCGGNANLFSLADRIIQLGPEIKNLEVLDLRLQSIYGFLPFGPLPLPELNSKYSSHIIQSKHDGYHSTLTIQHPNLPHPLTVIVPLEYPLQNNPDLLMRLLRDLSYNLNFDLELFLRKSYKATEFLFNEWIDLLLFAFQRGLKKETIKSSVLPFLNNIFQSVDSIYENRSFLDLMLNEKLSQSQFKKVTKSYEQLQRLISSGYVDDVELDKVSTGGTAWTVAKSIDETLEKMALFLKHQPYRSKALQEIPYLSCNFIKLLESCGTNPDKAILLTQSSSNNNNQICNNTSDTNPS